jgi:hypothetical protein
LASSHYNMWLLYERIGNYPKACSSYERAVEIREKSLQSNHPHLQKYCKELANIKMQLWSICFRFRIKWIRVKGKYSRVRTKKLCFCRKYKLDHIRQWGRQSMSADMDCRKDHHKLNNVFRQNQSFSVLSWKKPSNRWR